MLANNLAIAPNLDRENGSDMSIQPLRHQLLPQIFGAGVGAILGIAIDKLD
jgi:hypothetical protein